MYRITQKHTREFQAVMRERLQFSMTNTALTPSKLRKRLLSNLRRRDYVDVANYALMLDASRKD